uniref:Uncharacterized protein n=1 Tax=Rhizophora mucronata TaxID=61149 RepID=A0A2P2NML9_RHIMU
MLAIYKIIEASQLPNVKTLLIFQKGSRRLVHLEAYVS